MNTTNLFVELVVTGIGAAVWVLLIVLALFNVDGSTLNSAISTPVLAVPALAFVYLLGILTDRVSDSLANYLYVDRKVDCRFGSKRSFYAAREKCIARGEFYAQQYDYSRSRQRICRGWLLNSVLCIGALILHYEVGSDVFELSLSDTFKVSLLLLLLATACSFSWIKLVDTELVRISDAAGLHEIPH